MSVSFAVFASEQQIHIKAWAFEVPKGTVADFDNILNSTNSAGDMFTGILNYTNASIVLQSLRSRKGVEELGEPEATTASGRQTQLRTIILDVIAGISEKNHVSGSNSNAPEMTTHTGLVMDVIPYVLSDGYTITMNIFPWLTQSHNEPSGEHFAKVNLWDGQTVVCSGVETNFVDNVNALAGRPNDRELLVFITATIVDSAGNRIYSDDEMPFAKNGAPQQPPQPK